ncbi:hypothetical protein IWQ60_012188 [Tieghemiomyces parasiticus]|uniref:FHA domain-containing protein n=1 Tax=Tieghemiomyces parasiticus TaxID=78921 RepID=A0A9W7ZMN3_9FUNG|nr:hypothetical protein IWQ60_012188 [Tieghemiomyces parasiticus]
MALPHPSPHPVDAYVTRSWENFDQTFPSGILVLVGEAPNSNVRRVVDLKKRTLVQRPGAPEAQPLPNNLVFDCPSISRRHAELWYSSDDQAYYVQDLGSRNGTTLNADFIATPGRPGDKVQLHHGDVVRFGRYRADSIGSYVALRVEIIDTEPFSDPDEETLRAQTLSLPPPSSQADHGAGTLCGNTLNRTAQRRLSPVNTDDTYNSRHRGAGPSPPVTPQLVHALVALHDNLDRLLSGHRPSCITPGATTHPTPDLDATFAYPAGTLLHPDSPLESPDTRPQVASPPPGAAALAFMRSHQLPKSRHPHQVSSKLKAPIRRSPDKDPLANQTLLPRPDSQVLHRRRRSVPNFDSPSASAVHHDRSLKSPDPPAGPSRAYTAGAATQEPVSSSHDRPHGDYSTLPDSNLYWPSFSGRYTPDTSGITSSVQIDIPIDIFSSPFSFMYHSSAFSQLAMIPPRPLTESPLLDEMALRSQQAESPLLDEMALRSQQAESPLLDETGLRSQQIEHFFGPQCISSYTLPPPVLPQGSVAQDNFSSTQSSQAVPPGTGRANSLQFNRVNLASDLAPVEEIISPLTLEPTTPGYADGYEADNDDAERQGLEGFHYSLADIPGITEDECYMVRLYQELIDSLPDPPEDETTVATGKSTLGPSTTRPPPTPVSPTPERCTRGTQTTARWPEVPTPARDPFEDLFDQEFASCLRLPPLQRPTEDRPHGHFTYPSVARGAAETLDENDAALVRFNLELWNDPEQSDDSTIQKQDQKALYEEGNLVEDHPPEFHVNRSRRPSEAWRRKGRRAVERLITAFHRAHVSDQVARKERATSFSG